MSDFPDPIPGIIPFGSICTFAGASGVGKTAMLASWAARFRDGLSICGHPVNRPTAIGIVSGDRKWQSHRQWFDAVGFPEIAHYSLRDNPDFKWECLRDYKNLPETFSQAIDQLHLPPGGLAIIDPMPFFIPGKLIDYKDMAIGIGAVDKVLTPKRITVIGVFHTAKQQANKQARYLRPQDRLLGSTAQLGFTDTTIYICAPDELETDYYGLGWVPHNAPSAMFKFTKDENGLFIPYNDLEGLVTIEAILACVPSEQISTGPLLQLIASRCKLSAATAKRHLGTLLRDGRIQQPARGRYVRAVPS